MIDKIGDQRGKTPEIAQSVRNSYVMVEHAILILVSTVYGHLFRNKILRQNSTSVFPTNSKWNILFQYHILYTMSVILTM